VSDRPVLLVSFISNYFYNSSIQTHIIAVAALSTTLSTAALDKNPQSKQRGITLDLGFSSFTVPSKRVFPNIDTGYDGVQFTLVDCPGHASLVRTIVGGAHIIDMMILVVDVMKGIQARTAECLVIGEITTKTMIVALNKIGSISEFSDNAMLPLCLY
jgi:selenocysteine-specific elongation factor